MRKGDTHDDNYYEGWNGNLLQGLGHWSATLLPSRMALSADAEQINADLLAFFKTDVATIAA